MNTQAGWYCAFQFLLVSIVLSGSALRSVAQEEKIMTTQSGLKYSDLKEGTGEKAKKGDLVSVHYTGWLKDGKKFDSSKDSGKPFQFRLGAGKVIKGWDEGVQGIKVGGKRKLIIPAKLAYGEKGYDDVIPPNAELTFEVELLKIGTGN